MPVSNWIELESRARLGVYCKKMQGLYYHMKAAMFRTMVRDHRKARELLDVQTIHVTVIQKYARRMVNKHKMARMAQGFLIKYIPDIGHPYWFNPSTKVTKTEKPPVLMHLDCLSISMPPVGLEYVPCVSFCLFLHVLFVCISLSHSH